MAVTVLVKEDFLNAQQWRCYIEQEIGFVLPDMQLQWLVNAVDHTAAVHQLTVAQLWTALPFNSELRQKLLDAVLIPESRFFRHIPSIQFVTERALQYQQQAHLNGLNTDNLFRIWSVGCAHGQEVWTLAMSLASKQMTNYAILGTDVSQRALTKARLGRYDDRQRHLIPQDCQQFIQPLSPEHAACKPNLYDLSTINQTSKTIQPQWQIAATLQQHVSFTWHNIFTQELATPSLQQVIICQNMLLYFRKFDQRDILTRLSAQCVLGGYIILAPGEALFWRPSNMRRIAHPQINAWQKISA
ncbi:CheR family methyltransferase [Psychrobacter sp. LV10R520-6]|uniref:CheR family methyltransferase n=1 Tax=Psychrobacter sp. LV10R520-6 TaxID=1415574 RepID=UPI0024CC04CB|nr:CheR family methyltransferase [Psychrobacter sp. LV10R520-6]SNT70650.1 MCP methyltransferase, CheR-type [Psychrobacter sp. LV10R520-6]